jgi:hypothetical protein
MLERPRAGGVTVLSDPIHDYLAEIGRKGGAAGRGSAKARTSEQARAAVQARWARTKRKKRRKPSRHNPTGHAPARSAAEGR